MKGWLRRIRGAIGMGITWAIGWAIVGIGIGFASILLPFLPWDAFFDIFDAPLPAMAVPGFFAGAFFSIVLDIGARKRRFDELSLPVFTAWGAVGGVMLGLFPAALVGVGLASMGRPDLSLGGLTAVIVGPFALLSAGSAAVTLLIARRAERQALGGTAIAGADASPALGEGTGGAHAVRPRDRESADRPGTDRGR